LLGACGEEDRLTWTATPPVCQDGVNCCPPEEIICQGDPDTGVTCACRNPWICNDLWYPSKCSPEQPDTPDGANGWTCTIDPEFEHCEQPGSTAPDGKNGWSCKVVGDSVVCQRPTTTPDGLHDWDCTFVDGVKLCKKKLGTGSGAPTIPSISKSGCVNSTDPPDFMVLIDRSGSMTGLVGTTSKWSQATSAVNDLVSAFQGEMRFGLMMFPQAGTSCSGGGIDVAVGDNTSSAIAAALSAATPIGGTPIASSLNNAVSAMSATSKFVLLVTDGGETCGGDPISQVKALFGMQIKTYVIGFGSGVDAAQLNGMALAGGTALPATTKYYQADNQAQLRYALEAIGNQVCK